MTRFLLITILLISTQAVAQIGVEEFDSNINPGVGIRTIPQRQKELIGSTFLFENWTVGDVHLKTGSVLKGIPIKYDILGQDLLILREDNLLGVKLNFVDKFNLLTADGENIYFVVNKDWTIEGERGTGVYQILVNDGNFGLVKITKVLFVKANYYVALDAGQKDDEYVQSSDLYFLDYATKDLQKAPKSKKKIIDYFGIEEIKEFIKSERIDFKSEDGLKQIIQFANSTNTNN
jgi:hypothetical protein